jgi:hypothetical protein
MNGENMQAKVVNRKKAVKKADPIASNANETRNEAKAEPLLKSTDPSFSINNTNPPTEDSVGCHMNNNVAEPPMSSKAGEANYDEEIDMDVEITEKLRNIEINDNQ